MDAKSRRNRMVCNSCKNVFNLDDATIVYKSLYGIKIREKVCPQCGGTFRAVEIPEELDRYLYVDRDDRYYY